MTTVNDNYWKLIHISEFGTREERKILVYHFPNLIHGKSIESLFSSLLEQAKTLERQHYYFFAQFEGELTAKNIDDRIADLSNSLQHEMNTAIN